MIQTNSKNSFGLPSPPKQIITEQQNKQVIPSYLNSSLFCQDAIQILNLVVPKPQIPKDISSNYKQVKVQWTEQLVATQQQRTEQIKKETESLKAVADARRQKAVLQIEIEKRLMQKEGEKNLSEMENDIVKRREESNADVENYKKKSMAEANKLLYTPEFLQLESARSLANNTKFYFSGENTVLGGLLQGFMKH